MTKHLWLGAAAGALAIAGVGVSVSPSQDGAPFIHPLAVAQSLCGDGDADSLTSRRKFFIRAATAYADATPDAAAHAGAMDAPLGEISYAISTDSADAQAWFNRGLAHTYNFNHGEAIVAFRKAQDADPACAMCVWGEAFALGPNINMPMIEEAAAPAWDALTRMRALRENASEKEQGLIDALAVRYAEAPPADRSGLDIAFADAMDALALQYTEDDFIQALAAEANMDTQPWDYWEPGGRTPKGRTARTISLLEGVLARNPLHTASIHLYIHITEASRDPYRAAPHADRLADLTPGLGHLIHMPSHIYYRIGRFDQSLAHNVRAIAVDAAYIENENSAPGPIYAFGYFNHNIHFAMTSAMMAGDGETALAMAQRLDDNLPIEMAAAAPFIQPVKAAPYYAMVQYGEADDILALAQPADAFPFLVGAWRYARGEALARKGDAAGAYREAEAIAEIVAAADLAVLTDNNVPALDILNIARMTVTARAAAVEGNLDTAIEAMEEAVALQDAIAYTEPPYWYYPAKQTLAAMVLERGDTERAEQLFLEALTQSPNNALVLFGLSETYKQEGDRNAAKYAGALFKEAWLGEKKPALSLNRL